MTRKSKRELERVVEQLTDSGTSAIPAAPLADHSEAVVDCIHDLARDLERIADRHPDAIVNADDSAATSRYLELVRDDYRLDEDRDAAVQTALENIIANNYPRTSPGAFVGFVLAVPAYVYAANEEGESLEDLVDAGHQEETKRALVATAYELLADAGDNTDAGWEVPA